jgi:tagatose 1,6-diphosphate aldolase
MQSINISSGKLKHLNACADQRGIITALAVDHRTPLSRAIAEARGGSVETSAADMLTFKQSVTEKLTPYVSAILLDPEYSLPAIPSRAPGCGLMLAYERTGYDAATPGRLPDVLAEWSVRRLAEQGADGIKILMYYNPAEQGHVNQVKQAFVERIGAECAALDVPFFLEPLIYSDSIDERGLAFAKAKPALMVRVVEEFSRPRYGVDVLKVDAPVNMRYVAGTSAFQGEAAYSYAESLDHFRALSAVAARPLIYLSAGVSEQVFREMLTLAAAAGASYAGVLCGRATWQDGVKVYAQQGGGALDNWLAGSGVQNVQALNKVLAAGAKPWWTMWQG